MSRENLSISKRVGIRIAFIYLLVSIGWVLASDMLLKHYITSTWFNILKGSIFVCVNALLLYKLIQRNIEIVAREKEYYRLLIENSLETNLIHINGKIVYMNQAGVELLKAKDKNEIVGKTVYDLIPPKERDIVSKRVEEAKKHGKSKRTVVAKYTCLNGEEIICESLSFKTSFQGEPAIHVLIRDVTEREKTIKKMNTMAFYDELTALPNRNKLYQFIEQLMKKQEYSANTFTVMFIDMDRFKMVNDAMGHSSGDKMLKEVAKRLASCINNETLLARIGGDEFVIVIPCMRKEQASVLAQQIIDSFKHPITINHTEIYTTPSIGITSYPDDGEDVDTLIKNADTAMYLAKRTGKNSFQLFNQELTNDLNNELLLIHDIRKAFERNEFILQYQPQVDLETNTVFGVESLIRWNHPKKGILSPEVFIPIAEENGLIVELGYWVLDTACRQLRLWHENGLTNIRMGVNISPIQFLHKDFIFHLERAILENKLDPCYLHLEITETVFMEINESLLLLKKLKDIGVQISIDDFGTGYSSLSVLKDLPIDYLKIDKSFIDTIHSDEKNILQPIIDMGYNLNLKLIAEGVEYEEQLKILKDRNCHIGQGYYFCKPMEVDGVEAYIKEKR